MKEPMNMSEHPVYMQERKRFVDILPTIEKTTDYTNVPFDQFCDMQAWGAVSQALGIEIGDAPLVFFHVAASSATLEEAFKRWATANPEVAKELLA